MGKVYVFLADGFEEVEGLTAVDLLRRAKVETVMVSVAGKLEVTGSHGISVKADCLFEEMDPSEAEMYVLPGGMPGTIHLGEHKGLAALLQSAEQEGKKVAAICAAPSVLGKLGLLKGRKATCYPGFEEKLEGAEVTENQVECSGMVTTSRGVGTAIEFALSLIAQLKDPGTAEEIGNAIVWRK